MLRDHLRIADYMSATITSRGFLRGACTCLQPSWVLPFWWGNCCYLGWTKRCTGALAGFRYSAVQRTLWFGPAVPDRPFKTFFSTAFGFGTIVLDRRSLHI